MKRELQSPPKIGERRNVLKFAWLPTEVKQPHTKKIFLIWLEKYHETQIYRLVDNGVVKFTDWDSHEKWIE